MAGPRRQGVVTGGGRCRRALGILLPVLAAVMSGAVPPLAATEASDSPLCTDDAMLVFDASSSMARLTNGGGTRIGEAREAARRVVPAASRSRRLGLVVYGPGDGGDACANIALSVPPASGTAGRILAEIEATPTAGPTPLTRSVEAASEALGFRERRSVVVLLTDGDETCGGDPCATARRLKAEARGLTVHVLGFMLGTFARFRAACLAEETGGLFVPAQTLDELEEALSRTLACPETAQGRQPPSGKY